MLSKGGDTDEFHSFIGFFPDAGAGIVVMSNSNAAKPTASDPASADALGKQLLDLLAAP
jgi:hypothetical protein